MMSIGNRDSFEFRNFDPEVDIIKITIIAFLSLRGGGDMSDVYISIS